jgi:hypothetical protein
VRIVNFPLLFLFEEVMFPLAGGDVPPVSHVFVGAEKLQGEHSGPGLHATGLFFGPFKAVPRTTNEKEEK